MISSISSSQSASTNVIVRHASRGKLLGCLLAVRRRCGVDHQRFSVSDIRQVRNESAGFDELLTRLQPTLDSGDREPHQRPFWQILPRHLVGRMGGKSGIIHPIDQGVFFEESRTANAFSQWRGILRCSVSSPCKNRNTFEGTQRTAQIPQPMSSTSNDVTQLPHGLAKHGSMIGRVGLGELLATCPASCVQSKLPLSTITPPMLVPCPPMNLVAL